MEKSEEKESPAMAVVENPRLNGVTIKQFNEEDVKKVEKAIKERDGDLTIDELYIMVKSKKKTPKIENANSEEGE